MLSLGVDVGGTFTDLVLIDPETRRIRFTKTPSTPRAPDEGVVQGIEKVVRTFGVAAKDIGFLIHGTTVATNALIERKGMETALIVTRGFRDVLTIARQVRPRLYDPRRQRPRPFVPRHLCFEVGERLRYDGEAETPLSEEDVRAAAREIRGRGIPVAAVCLLHSYANPSHERRVREILQEEAPELKVCLSSEVLPEMKEYERMSTTVINAYVMPIVEGYLRRIMESLERIDVGAHLHIMQSNGGVMGWEMAGPRSVHTVLSGPAAGVLGAVELCGMMGERNIITIDMGGTSFDVCLAYDGEPAFSVESDIDGHAIKIPMIDIKTLGAGGGSLAWIDPGGALQVGPESAGADPGPACYGRGGDRPTVTDANLVLGYLNPHNFLGGEMRLDPERARESIRRCVADPMGLSVEAAAEGIVRVVNAEMIRGIRRVSVERGLDPREFALVSFGGAGPLHAVALAQELDIPKVIVPVGPGVTCALGLLMADFRHDYSQTHLARVASLDLDALNVAFREIEARAQAHMEQEGVPADRVRFRRSLDMRYAGQGYELEVKIPPGDYGPADSAAFCEGLAQAHRDQYGYCRPDEQAEIVSLRVVAVGELPKPDLPRGERIARGAPPVRERRRIYADGGYTSADVYAREDLEPGAEFAGPAIVEQLDSTTVVLSGCRVEVDEWRNLVIGIAPAYDDGPSGNGAMSERPAFQREKTL